MPLKFATKTPIPPSKESAHMLGICCRDVRVTYSFRMQFYFKTDHNIQSIISISYFLWVFSPQSEILLYHNCIFSSEIPFHTIFNSVKFLLPSLT